MNKFIGLIALVISVNCMAVTTDGEQRAGDKAVATEAGSQESGIVVSRERLLKTKELVDQMMMELRFRGLADDHELVQQALETGRWINSELRRD